MCARFTLGESIAKLAGRFDLPPLNKKLKARFNIAPGQDVPVIPGSGERRLEMMRWGLTPPWAKAGEPGAGLINARAETARSKPSFKGAFRLRRCLVPADGFYEWQNTPAGKEPWRFHLGGGKLFAMAGLWETRSAGEGGEEHTFAILTCPANELVARVHPRMPVILTRSNETAWLELPPEEPDALQEVLKPYPAGLMESYRVSPLVNSSQREGASLIEPAPKQRILF